MMHGFGYGWGDMMSSGTYFGGTGWMVFSMMGIGLLVVVALIAWLVWSQRQALGFDVSRHSLTSDLGATHGSGWSGSPSEAVEQIARRRYASGEIDAAEFRQMMMTLREQ